MSRFFRRKATPSVSVPNPDEAIALGRAGDHEGALAKVDELLRDQPGVALSHRFRGETLFALERYDEALDAFAMASELGGPGTEELVLWIALCSANGGHPDTAIAVLEDYIAWPYAAPETAQKCRDAITVVRERR